jgi:MerR family transcriptional regulator, light-induced transcriptional regulator
MQNKSSPKKPSLPQSIEAGSLNMDNGGGGSNWSTTLEDLRAQASTHISLRRKPEAEKSKTFQAILAAVVEGQVIPRLMLAHKQAKSHDALDGDDLIQCRQTSQPSIDAAIIKDFAALVLNDSIETLEDYIVDLTREGLSTHDIYLDLMAPTARLLGQYWENDECSFTDVTLGLGQLQTLLYRLSASHPPLKPARDAAYALFLTPEGAQHSLGVRMVEELFRDAGWQTRCEINTPLEALVDLVKAEAYDLIGVSLSAEGQIEIARTYIAQLRSASANPNVQIIVGGKLILDDPDLALRLGADMSARDGKEAIVIATKLNHSHHRTH